MGNRRSSLGGGDRRYHKSGSYNNTKLSNVGGTTTKAINNTLKVLVDPRMTQLDVAVIGSFVTIIGNFVALPMIDDSNNSDKCNAIIAPITIEPASTLLIDDGNDINHHHPVEKNIITENKIQLWEVYNNDDLGRNYNGHKKSTRYKLEARTFQVVNNNNNALGGGTDLTLYGTALRSRREDMYRRYYNQSQQHQQKEMEIETSEKEQEHNTKKSRNIVLPKMSLLQGCGPPPYGNLLKD